MASKLTAIESYREHVVQCLLGFLDEAGTLPGMSDRAVANLKKQMIIELAECNSKAEVAMVLNRHGATKGYLDRIETEWQKTEFAAELS